MMNKLTTKGVLVQKSEMEGEDIRLYIDFLAIYGMVEKNPLMGEAERAERLEALGATILRLHERLRESANPVICLGGLHDVQSRSQDEA